MKILNRQGVFTIIFIWLSLISFICKAYLIVDGPSADTTKGVPGKVVINIGSRLEMFVDDLIIESMDNVEFRLHQPQRMPLPESPLKGNYATVIKDGDVYRGYYRGNDPGYKGPRDHSGHPGEITCYAESFDGHEWTFPDLGLFEVNGTLNNNVILAGQPPFSHNFSPFLDIRPGVDPGERFKALAGHPGYQRDKKANGLHAFVSADGIVWKKAGEQPVIPYKKEWSHAFDSQNVSFWSEIEQKYICYFRGWETPHGKLRTIYRTTSPDFKNWSEPVAMNPNLPREHLYTNQTHPYFRAPHIYIALPSRYTAGRVGTENTESMLGSTDIMFMSSRAGTTSYNRLFTEAFIRPGLDPERWQNRANYVALNVVPTSDTEMSIYHHKSGRRYVLRTDGFISVRSGESEGELLTKLLTFNGNKLIINFSTAAAGSLQVEIQDADGKPVPGFSLEDCPVIVGDKIEHVVSWDGEPELSTLAGKPVRLRFVMLEADSYSLRFKY